MSVFRKQYTKPMPAGSKIVTRKGKKCAQWTDRYGHTHTDRLIEFKTVDGKPDRTKKSRVTRHATTFTVRYRDATGVVREVNTGCRTKDAAQSVLRDLQRRAELVKAGVITAAESAASDQARTSILDHVAAYIRHLSLTASERHVKNVDANIGRIVVDCGIQTLQDLQGEAITDWLALHRDQNMAPRTRNIYRAAVHGFASWCVKTGRLTHNPVAQVPRTSERVDQRHQRRALTDDEVARLLHVARLRPVAEYGRHVEKTRSQEADNVKRSNWRRVALTFDTVDEAYQRGRNALEGRPDFLAKLLATGEERALIYRTLLLTGLRKGELASLTLAKLDLDADPPYAMLDAADEKNRQGAQIPLHLELVRDIRSFLHTRRIENEGPLRVTQLSGNGRTSGTAIALFNVPRDLYRILNRDLAAAGIPKRDQRGRVVDVHALRHTFGTNLSRCGVPLRTAQAAMRHSTPELTANVYTDPMQLDVAGAVNELPVVGRRPAVDADIAAGSSPDDQTMVA